MDPWSVPDPVSPLQPAAPTRAMWCRMTQGEETLRCDLFQSLLFCACTSFGGGEVRISKYLLSFKHHPSLPEQGPKPLRLKLQASAAAATCDSCCSSSSVGFEHQQHLREARALHLFLTGTITPFAVLRNSVHSVVFFPR